MHQSILSQYAKESYYYKQKQKLLVKVLVKLI